MASGGTAWDLVRQALADQDGDGETQWRAIALLQERGDTETFTAARRLCASDEPRERALGATILGQPGHFAEQSVPILRYLAASDDDPHVLYNVLIALGHLGDRRAVPSVIDLAGHDDAAVRYGAAHALPRVMSCEPEAISALIALTTDADPDVREWATFGLAVISSADTPEIRAALAARLIDDSPDTAGEALRGLARRGDARAFELLYTALTGEPNELIVEAAADLSDSRLHPALCALRRTNWADTPLLEELLENAIARCAASSPRTV